MVLKMGKDIVLEGNPLEMIEFITEMSDHQKTVKELEEADKKAEKAAQRATKRKEN